MESLEHVNELAKQMLPTARFRYPSHMKGALVEKMIRTQGFRETSSRTYSRGSCDGLRLGAFHPKVVTTEFTKSTSENPELLMYCGGLDCSVANNTFSGSGISNSHCRNEDINRAG
jgi:hypothetical protein